MDNVFEGFEEYVYEVDLYDDEAELRRYGIHKNGHPSIEYEEEENNGENQ